MLSEILMLNSAIRDGGIIVIIVSLYILYHKIKILEKKILNGCIIERIARLEEKVNMVYEVVVDGNKGIRKG